MWKFASKCLVGTGGFTFKNGINKLTQRVQDSSDDEASSTFSKDDGLECPICCESFNLVENVPYVLWCGHSLCESCVLNLQWAVVKINPSPVQLPLIISCPWCNLLSPRIVIKGKLTFPRKNYFLLWMVERLNNDKVKSHCKDNDSCSDCQPSNSTSTSQLKPSDVQRDQSFIPSTSHYRVIRMQSYLQRSLFFFLELTTKIPLVLIFLLLVLYAIPASAIILVVYIVVTIVFGLPSFLVLYFSYPSLDWLVKEVMS